MAIGEQVQKNPRYYTVSIIFLGFVLLLTAIILAYSMSVGASNKKSKEKLDSLNESITALNNDPDIQAYQLYDHNKKQIDNMIYYSNIPLFYSRVNEISENYGIKMSSFSYSDKKISINSSAFSDSSSGAYRKYEELIGSYRITNEELLESENQDEKIFDLEFVRSFQGSNRIMANIDFTVLEPKPKKVETPEVDVNGGDETNGGVTDTQK